MAGIPNRKKAISLTAISTTGDLRTYPTGTYVIPPGTDGYVLQSDSTSATGFSWTSASGGGSLSYSNGLFTFTPPTVTVIALTLLAFKFHRFEPVPNDRLFVEGVRFVFV